MIVYFSLKTHRTMERDELDSCGGFLIYYEKSNVELFQTNTCQNWAQGLFLLLLFINISTGTSCQLQLTVFHISPANYCDLIYCSTVVSRIQ